MSDRDDSAVIMLVDDDDIALAALNALFALETDHQVLTFSEPQEALEEANRTPLDLVISDFLMPRMNGLELLTQIQQVQPDTMAILLTGFADKKNAIRAVNELDLFQYLEKPWDNAQLLLVVRRALRQNSLTRQLTEKVKELDRLLGDHHDLQERHGVMERELEMAARVQRSLLPASMPDVSGFGFSAFYQPSREIGGDYYSLCSSPERSALLLADVSGHGIQAALISLLLKAIFEEACAHCRSATELVEEMNLRLHRFLPGNMFVAATVAWIARAGSVQLVNAGLPFPFVLRAGPGRVDEIPVAGMPMGIFGGNGPASFDTTEVELAPGDILLLASDGLGDVEDSGGAPFQDGHLLRAMEELNGQSRDQVIQGLVDRTQQFAGGREAPDDICLVAVSRE